ncbi:hypothetical protein ACTJJ7_26730 [Phyllobacterium sp. 22229]|uniref:Uncharacterized protein n=1 Tax=Phyllobacterium myrsinacearum TaxID=28101 RepID=A0A2S9JAS8_9HYPH|nr:hypothetical protein [Phyllobacterium myrsinacearum]PRD49896.1 hypothetical protein C5750_24020 [Phyllobacterium myrsinacearum]PWV83392.1 hypothetical protein DEV92_1246 [Phyllobacterium myrsinacearum]RZS76752.1 hypothetical protein EV217_4975 [Phyllobacterium myrsinacearum]RZU97053.1 hypothetical protein EV654_5047 [Phyllobacterium myrsinacearum]
MNLMSVPAVAGISIGAAIAVTFNKKNRQKTAGGKAIIFIGSFLVTLAALLALNFGIYYSNSR